MKYIRSHIYRENVLSGYITHESNVTLLTHKCLRLHLAKVQMTHFKIVEIIIFVWQGKFSYKNILLTQ